MAPGPLGAPPLQHDSKIIDIPFSSYKPSQAEWEWNVADASGYFRGLFSPPDPQSYFDNLWKSFAAVQDEPGGVSQLVTSHPELNPSASQYIQSFGSAPAPNIPPPSRGK